jgi:hypothetical protein
LTFHHGGHKFGLKQVILGCTEVFLLQNYNLDKVHMDLDRSIWTKLTKQFACLFIMSLHVDNKFTVCNVTSDSSQNEGM